MIDLYSNPENEINEINSAGIRIRGGKPIALHKYQEDFIRNIYENKCAYAVKARCCGMTLAYILHAIFTLKRHFENTGNLRKILFISFNMENCANCNKTIKEILEQIDNKEFAEKARECFEFCSCNILRTRSIGNSRMCYNAGEEDGYLEVYLDEFAFFEKYYDIDCIEAYAECGKLVGTTSMAPSNAAYKHVKSLFKRGNAVSQFIPWYLNEKFNKNMFWVSPDGEKEYEPTIDEEGNVAVDMERWGKMLFNGWRPSSPWMEEHKNNSPLNRETIKLEMLS